MMETLRALAWVSIIGGMLAACESSTSNGGNGRGCDDGDLDGVCDDVDVCPASDDAVDADGDGTPDGCDACPADAIEDLDADGICNSVDSESCEDSLDNDGDGAVDCADAACAGDVLCTGVLGHGSLVGSVVDIAGNPLDHVFVHVGEAVTITDAGGHFVLLDLPVGTSASLASFDRGGYGSFARLVVLRADDVVYTNAVLKAANVVAWWQDAAAGFTVDAPGQIRVTFPAGSLLDEEGAPVTGAVNVEIVTGDPTNPLDAPIMPGDYLSDEAGGTPLDSVAFVDITVRTLTGLEVHGVDPGAPLVVELPIPTALQGDAVAGNTIPWWSFEETAGTWRREGTAEVFDDGGTLWVRALATHLSWWNCDRPINEHACVCVDVVDGAGDPIAGAQLGAQGVTYNGGSSAVYSNDVGRACITVKNSVASPEQVGVFVQAGGAEIPYPDNPVTTPAVVASCLRDVGCPDLCEVLSQTIVLDRSGVVGGTVTMRSGAPAVGLLVANDHAASMATDAAGGYSLPAFLDVPLHVFTAGYTSPELLATAMAPNVTHDIALDNLPPELVDLSINGVPQVLTAERGLNLYVSDGTVPVEFDAHAIDLDGDTVGYAWSGWCYETPGGQVPLDCTPPDAPSTTCDPPGSGGGPTQEGCQYVLSLDDGYVLEPIVWYIWISELAGP